MHFLQILSFLLAFLFPFVAAAPHLKPRYVGTGKRGLAFNNLQYTQPFSSSSNSSPISWAYDWSSSLPGGQPPFPPSLRYIPMLWSNNPSLTSTWNANVQKAQSSLGADALLTFNEPDNCGANSGSACMSISDSVAAYKQYVQPFAGTIQLGAPAVTNGGGNNMGLGWLAQFMQACTGCTVDFITLHYYGSVSDLSGLQNHVAQAYQQFGKPIWVTEYGANGGTPAQVLAWLQAVVPWLDAQPYVVRHSYFYDGPGDNFLINSNGSGLSSIGQYYSSS